MSGTSAPKPDFVLGALAYDVLWEHLGLGEHPLMLPVDSHGETETQRRMLIRQCWSELEAASLARGSEVRPELAAALRTLSAPPQELTAIVRAPGAPKIQVVGAASGSRGVIAMRDGQALRIAIGTAAGLVRSFLAVLPHRPAAAGRSISVPTDALDGEAPLAASAVEDRLRAAGMSTSEARAFSAAIRGPKSGLGKISAAARDYANVRARAGWIVSYLDTERGRYSLVSKPGGDARWSTIAPADPERMQLLVTEMLDSVTSSDDQPLPSGRFSA